MIICHCQNITDHDIRSAIDWMRAADPMTIITPRKVYRALNKDADCGGCMPLFLDTMRGAPGFVIPDAPTKRPATKKAGPRLVTARS